MIKIAQQNIKKHNIHYLYLNHVSLIIYVRIDFNEITHLTKYDSYYKENLIRCSLNVYNTIIKYLINELINWVIPQNLPSYLVNS